MLQAGSNNLQFGITLIPSFAAVLEIYTKAVDGTFAVAFPFYFQTLSSIPSTCMQSNCRSAFVVLCFCKSPPFWVVTCKLCYWVVAHVNFVILLLTISSVSFNAEFGILFLLDNFFPPLDSFFKKIIAM